MRDDEKRSFSFLALGRQAQVQVLVYLQCKCGLLIVQDSRRNRDDRITGKEEATRRARGEE